MSKMRKIKWHVLVLALLVWLMSGMLSGCLVRIDPETGGQERQIYEKPIKEGVSGGEENYAGQADVLPEEEESCIEEQEARGTEESDADEPDMPETKLSDTRQPENMESHGADTKQPEELTPSKETEQPEASQQLDRDGFYRDKEQVALYIHLYGRLPGNYISKSRAEELGWDSGKGNLDEVAPGMSIGGGRFGNREELLPKKDGRTYYECDIDYDGGYRGAKRIVYSNDGLIYYTEDHYKTFELLYTSEGIAE